jgi:hypothetical protein
MPHKSCQVPGCPKSGCCIEQFYPDIVHGVAVTNEVRHCGEHTYDELQEFWAAKAIKAESQAVAIQATNPYLDCKKLMRKKNELGKPIHRKA